MKSMACMISFGTGSEFNINSPKQLGEVLFERLMLPAPKKTKTKKENPVEKLYKSVEDYSPLNDEDKRYILDKLQAITRKQFTNLSEEDFKVLMNIKDDWSEE